VTSQQCSKVPQQKCTKVPTQTPTKVARQVCEQQAPVQAGYGYHH